MGAIQPEGPIEASPEKPGLPWAESPKLLHPKKIVVSCRFASVLFDNSLVDIK
jgi:hypothetical protein